MPEHDAEYHLVGTIGLVVILVLYFLAVGLLEPVLVDLWGRDSLVPVGVLLLLALPGFAHVRWWWGGDDA